MKKANRRGIINIVTFPEIIQSIDYYIKNPATRYNNIQFQRSFFISPPNPNYYQQIT